MRFVDKVSNGVGSGKRSSHNLIGVGQRMGGKCGHPSTAAVKYPTSQDTQDVNRKVDVHSTPATIQGVLIGSRKRLIHTTFPAFGSITTL